MGRSTEPADHVARKAHACSICGTTIKPGNTYTRWRWFEDGDASVVKVHPDCRSFFQDHDITEWVTGDTFEEQLFGGMCTQEALEAIAGFEDAALKALWLEEAQRRIAEDKDNE